LYEPATVLPSAGFTSETVLSVPLSTDTDSGVEGLTFVTELGTCSTAAGAGAEVVGVAELLLPATGDVLRASG
jgi:hypothetical protein